MCSLAKPVPGRPDFIGWVFFFCLFFLQSKPRLKWKKTVVLFSKRSKRVLSPKEHLTNTAVSLHP